VKHSFTINEFRSFADVGHRGVEVDVGGKTVTIALAPGLKLLPAELNQIRHHAVLAHGLVVENDGVHGTKGFQVQALLD
jgi:beta-glucosidase